MNHYPAIFEPLTIRRMTLKNRIVMPTMGTNFAAMDRSFVQEHIDYYVQRAKGGTGLINIGDSKQARRIINGTREGRNILKTI